MSDAQQFLSGGVPKPSGLINGTSQLPYTYTEGAAPLLYVISGYLKSTATGSLTANVLAEVLNVSGRGVLSFLACASGNAASRAHRFKVTLDGIVVFDATSVVLASQQAYFPVVGQLVPLSQTYSTFSAVPEPIFFDKSLLIEYASNNTEVGQTQIAYRYYPR